MKKVLLGTSALAALALVATPAAAQTDLTISGNVDANFGFGDEDFPNRPLTDMDYGARSDTFIRFSFSTTADNGLTYGGVIDLDDGRETTESGSAPDDFDIDEAYLFVSGDWGEIRLGNKEGQAENLRATIPTVGNGGIDGDYSSYVTGATPATGTGFSVIGGDQTRISYIGDFEGLTFGVSYAPEAGGQLGTNLGAPGYTDIFDMGANYTFDFDGGSVTVNGVVGFADGGENTTGGGAVLTPLEDAVEYSVGALVNFGGFSAGGFYLNSGDFGTADGFGSGDLERWGLGATYTVDGWSFGLAYLGFEDDRQAVGALGTNRDRDGYGVSGDVAYALAPGLTVYASMTYFEQDINALDSAAGSPSTNEGVVGLAGATAAF